MGDVIPDKRLRAGNGRRLVRGQMPVSALPVMVCGVAMGRDAVGA